MVSPKGHTEKRRPFYLVALLLILLSANFLSWYAVFSEDQHGLLTVAFLDVGEGSAILIKAPDDEEILVDGGPDAGVLRLLAKMMPFYDRSFAATLISGYDTGRIGGIFSLLNSYHIGEVIEPTGSPVNSVGMSLIAALKQKNISAIQAQRNTEITLDKNAGIFLQILFPDRDMNTVRITTSNENENSLFLRLIYKNTSVLLAGDAPENIQNYLMELYGANLKSDILAVPHYGSATSTSAAFLQMVSPQYAVISAAANNRYGYPAKKTLDAISAAGAKVFSTLGQGSVVFQSDGVEWREKTIR